MDIFEKLASRRTDLGQYQSAAHGYFTFPKLEGDLNPIMTFRGKEVLNWSLNNYLGLANNQEVRKTDAKAADKWGLAYPMGARIMTGQTALHEQLENELAEFVGKERSYLLNYGYQGMVSIIDSLADRNDVIVYDSESHACIMDGVFLHKAKGGKSFVFPHNDMEKCEKMLGFAKKRIDETGGGILVITEGVFGMEGDLGSLKDIVELKKKVDFRLLVDDAHGFGTMGKTGAGTGEHFGVQNEIDVYFSTFAKSMAGIGAFVASDTKIVDYLQYTLRSQIFAKSLPMPMVEGALKRLDMLRSDPSHKEKLWTIVKALQKGLRDAGFDLGVTESPVTPVFMKGTVAEATNLLLDLRENFNIFCSIVVYPVVAKGVIMFRLIPTAVHTLEQVDRTIDAFKQLKGKLDKGEYHAEQVEVWSKLKE